MNNVRICFIGCGNMGRSLIGGILANGYPGKLICGTDPEPDQREKVGNLFGITTHADNLRAIAGADVVVLAVKPQVMAATVQHLAGNFGERQPLIISIAAGIRLSAIHSWLQQDLPIIRAEYTGPDTGRGHRPVRQRAGHPGA